MGSDYNSESQFVSRALQHIGQLTQSANHERIKVNTLILFCLNLFCNKFYL